MSSLQRFITRLPPAERRRISLQVVLQPYKGTWHHGVDLCKKWRTTWFHADSIPDWATQVHSWQQLNINSSEDDLRMSYKDLIHVAEQAARYGVKAIQLVGWNRGGRDRGNPSQDTDPRLGTAKNLEL